MKVFRIQTMFLVFGILVLAMIFKSNGVDPQASAANDVKGAKVDQLIKAKIDVLQDVVTLCEKAVATARIDYKQLYDAKQQLCRAQLDVCTTDAERIVVLEKCLEEAKQFEGIVQERVRIAAAWKMDELRAHVDCLDIEIELERLKSK